MNKSKGTEEGVSLLLSTVRMGFTQSLEIINLSLSPRGRRRACRGEGGVGAGQGRHDQHHGGPEEVQGGRVQEEEGGEAEDVHYQHGGFGGSLEIHTSSTPTFHTSSGRKPKPMYFKKKCGNVVSSLTGWYR